MVHFVIALFTISVLLDVLGFLSTRDKFHFAAWINLLGAGIAVILAVSSGLLEESRINIPESAKESFDTHENTAFITAVIILFLVFWRLGLKNRLNRNQKWLYILIASIGLVSLYVGAYQGGRLVYQHGLGIGNSRIESREIPPDNESTNRPSSDDLFYPPKDTVP
jgi:uncharacterized membrane protein